MISAELRPTETMVRNASSVMPISTPTMIATSMKKAVARSLTSASLSRRSMPSGVTSSRTRSVA